MESDREQTEALFETQEMEKKRIARELHDTTVQNLTAMIHKIEYCTLLVDKDPIQVKLELQTMISTIRSTISEMRNIIYDLRPMTIDDLKLVDSLTHYINHLMLETACRITLELEGAEPALSSVLKLNAFRLFQEAVNNALKHAAAEIIRVDLFFEEKVLKMQIRDDGCGFDRAEVNSDTSFGLSIMEERTLLLEGTLDIRSARGKGTEIIIVLPYKQ